MKTPSADMSPGLQGFLINFELSNLLTEVVTATNAHKAGRPYKFAGFGNSAPIQYFGGALAGESRLAALICLSQSPQHGWETWFSVAQYGKQLSELKTRVIPVETIRMEKALHEAEVAAQAAADDLANAGTSPSAMRYLGYRIGMQVYTEQRLHFIRRLSEMGKAIGGGSR